MTDTESDPNEDTAGEGLKAKLGHAAEVVRERIHEYNDDDGKLPEADPPV